MASTLTRELLAKSAVPRYDEFTLSNGLVARIRSITEDEKSAYESIVYDADGKFQVARLKLRRRKLIQLCLVDDAGVNLYTAAEVGTMKMDGGLASQLFDRMVKHCGLDAASDNVASAKNDSEPTPGSDLLSASASS